MTSVTSLGGQAQELDGEPVFQHNKCELAEIIALVGIEPNPGLDYVHIAKFAIALPSDTNDSDVEALRRLENYPNARRIYPAGRDAKPSRLQDFAVFKDGQN